MAIRERLSGNEAVAYAIKQINPDVMPAFPITPSTEIPQFVSTMIANGEIQMIINTPRDKDGISDDSYLRKAAIKARIPYITTMAGAKATAHGVNYVRTHADGQLKSLQELYRPQER